MRRREDRETMERESCKLERGQETVREEDHLSGQIIVSMEIKQFGRERRIGDTEREKLERQQ